MNILRLMRLLPILLILLSYCFNSEAKAAFHPGFKTVGIWEIDKQIRLDLAIWYPTKRAPTRVDYNDWEFQASRGAPPILGQHPTILFSHPSAGSRFSLHQLASNLARAGFVVVAPTHTGDNLDHMEAVFTLPQFFDRARDLRLCLDHLQADPELSSMIDFDRLGLLGIGAGGSASLLLAGAKFSSDSFSNYCQEDNQDTYCSVWAKSRLDMMLTHPNLSESQQDLRFKAFAAIDPDVPMLFSEPSLKNITKPFQIVLLQSAFASLNKANARLVAAMPTARSYSLGPINLAALTSDCSNTLEQNLPEICLGVSPDERLCVQNELATVTLEFFLLHLGQL